ncbi:MAG: hypothetical protein K9L56_14965 [Clostridiales bacterium]|nr:hypothetical protein [Clostridiales bacterium]
MYVNHNKHLFDEETGLPKGETMESIILKRNKRYYKNHIFTKKIVISILLDAIDLLINDKEFVYSGFYLLKRGIYNEQILFRAYHDDDIREVYEAVKSAEKQKYFHVLSHPTQHQQSNSKLLIHLGKIRHKVTTKMEEAKIKRLEIENKNDELDGTNDIIQIGFK